MKVKIGCIGLIPYKYHYQFIGLECSKGRGFILPGGKWEPESDKSFHHAAQREVAEEIGLVFPVHEFEYLWHGPDGYGFTTFAFKLNSRIVPDVETLKPTKEGKPCVVNWDQLFKSKYGAYYAVLYDVLRNK